MTARITTFALVIAVVLFVLPAGASSQQVTPSPWGYPPGPANPYAPYGGYGTVPLPGETIWGVPTQPRPGDQPSAPPNPYGGYGTAPNAPYVPLPNETIWGVPSRPR